MTEKECAICGSYFMSKRVNHIYCPKCSKNSTRLKERAQKNLDRITRNYWDIIAPKYQHICKQCGRAFENASEICEFCSGNCKYENRKEKAICEYCGKNLFSLGIIIKPNQTRGLFCSNECREKQKWKIARENGSIGICPVCEKEFIVPKNGKKYCSNDCYKKAIKTQPSAHEGEKKCAICHIWYKKETEYADNCCSKNCHDILINIQKKSAIKRADSEKRYALKKEAERKACEEKYIKENGLCSMCKTSYKDCERMQTNFRLSPKGAVFEGSLIVKCPKFKK